jgi:hypothetical protein
MEIIIRTESTESTAQPPSVQNFSEATTSPRGQAGAPTANAAEQVTAIDAINAGPAPAPPEHTGGPPVHIVASEYRHAETESALSAGAAPDIP